MRRDELVLGEMISAGQRAMQLVEGVEPDALLLDRLRLEGLLWNLTVLGEAASQRSGELKARFPAVEWRRPTQLRNRLVHGYWSVDVEILHTTARDFLPEFVAAVEAVLSQMETAEGP